MGATYLASHPRYPRCVVKEMKADISHIPKAAELFEREASALKRLSYPGIPRFYDHFIERGRKYLVMEVILGQSLESLQKQRGRFPEHQVIAWMIEVCRILEYIHRQ